MHGVAQVVYFRHTTYNSTIERDEGPYTRILNGMRIDSSDTNFWTLLWCRVGQSLLKLILSLSLNKPEMFLPGNANFQRGLCLPSTSSGIVPTKLHPNRGFPQLCNKVYCSGVRLHCLIVYKDKFTLAPVIYRPND